MLPLSDVINLINIKKETPDPYDQCVNLINSSTLANNQTHYLVNSMVETDNIQSLSDYDARLFSKTLPSTDLIDLINIKKEPSDPDDDNDNFISTKFEPASIQSLNNDDTEIFRKKSSAINQIGPNFDEFSTPILKQENIGVETESNNVADSTADPETSFISIKDEYYGNLTDFRDHSFENSHCDTNGKNFSSQQILKRCCREVHVKIQKLLICNKCNKVFLFKHTLKKHERTAHGKIQDWKCIHCDKSFTRKSYLKLHERSVHLNIRDWKCTYCDKSCLTKQHLEYHEHAVHLNIKNWKCAQCDKFFITKQALECHEREIHSGNRDWKCIQCNKSFATVRTLKNHERFVHLKIRDWKCLQCGKSFSRKYCLKQHERIVHLNIRDWKCAHCDKTFNYISFKTT